MDSPFLFDRPLPAEAVMGRDSDCELLLERVLSGRAVALLAPRRFGKTSLLNRVTWLLQEVHAVETVRVDLLGLASHADLAVRLERALAALRPGPLRRALESLLAGSELAVSLAPGVGLTARFGRRNAPDAIATLHGMLDVLARAASRHNIAVFLDEFQDVARVQGADALLRSYAQQMGAQAGWVFAGSEPSMMRTLFSQRERPFFGQAEIVELGRLPEAVALSIVTDGFDATDRDAGSQAVRVVAFVNGHPQRLMLVADRLWRRTPEGSTATEDAFAAALDDARRLTAPAHEELFAALPSGQRDVLRALVRSGSPYAADAARFLDLGKGTARRAVEALVGHGIVERPGDGRWRTVDPMLADWVTSQFPG